MFLMRPVSHRSVRQLQRHLRQAKSPLCGTCRKNASCSGVALWHGTSDKRVHQQIVPPRAAGADPCKSRRRQGYAKRK